MMNVKLLGWLGLITLLFSILWLAFLVASMVNSGPIYTLDQAIDFVDQPDLIFTLTYVNAALITVFATAFMTGLYLFIRSSIPTGALIGLMFLPAYTAFNLFVYLSQISIVPGLVRAMQPSPISAVPVAEGAQVARFLLSQMIQVWPSSGVAFINALAYALLGIPSIIFGLAIWRSSGMLRWGGGLLALNGAACMVGLLGLLINNSFLAGGTVFGGVLFILALPLIARAMMKN